MQWYKCGTQADDSLVFLSNEAKMHYCALVVKAKGAKCFSSFLTATTAFHTALSPLARLMLISQHFDVLFCISYSCYSGPIFTSKFPRLSKSTPTDCSTGFDALISAICLIISCYEFFRAPSKITDFSDLIKFFIKNIFSCRTHDFTTFAVQTTTSNLIQTGKIAGVALQG